MDIMTEAFELLQYMFNGLLQLLNRLWVYFHLENIIIPGLFISASFGLLIYPIVGRGQYGKSDTVSSSTSKKNSSKSSKKEKK